jgi:pimeloyl-ACP methyl ester carboxylesterase
LLIYHHGTPLSGLLPSLWAQVAQAEGVRLVSVDRAGYGGSDRHPGRRIADVVGDTEAVADAFGAERFLVFDQSGGGPYTLGCAAILPARVDAAVSMSGPAPFNAEGLDYMAGMGQDNIDEYNAALAGELPLRTYLSDQREALLATARRRPLCRMVTEPALSTLSCRMRSWVSVPRESPGRALGIVS